MIFSRGELIFRGIEALCSALTVHFDDVLINTRQ